MLSKVMCYALTGIEGYAVDVETDISAGLTGMEIVGLAGTAVKESKERIRSAIKNSGMILRLCWRWRKVSIWMNRPSVCFCSR